jgi:hypothetical protein
MLSARLPSLALLLSLTAGNAAADLVLPAGDRAPDAAWSGVAAARASAQTLAVWTAGRALVSHDGGGTFEEALPGDEAIGAAALADDGTLYVARGKRLGRRAPDGRSTWREVSGEPSLLAAGGGAVAWLDGDYKDRHFEISTDHGATFRKQAFPEEATPMALVIDDDRRLQIAVDSPCNDICGCDHVERYLGRVGSPSWRHVEWGGDYSGATYYAPPVWELGAGGWTYWGTTEHERQVLHAVRGGEEQTMGSFGEPYSLKVGSNGRTTLAVSNGVLYRFDGARAIALDRGAPAQVDQLAVDATGRALAIAKGRLWRWTRGEGWREIVPQAADRRTAQAPHDQPRQ